MNIKLLRIFLAFIFVLSFASCAKKGTPSGGVRDTIPPVMLKSEPRNYSTNFDGKEIEIRFDEYIKLKDLNQELIVSPPMKNNPFITPLNTSKVLKISIEDTLLENTTYVFNFGNSITDNNEGNVLEDYKYVFSTGSYIDSLKVRGQVRDAQLFRPEPGVSVMLYEYNSRYSDSMVYKNKPMYITSTKDTTGFFEFTNLRAGEYMLVALKEKSRSYTFNPEEDKIGFVAKPIQVPSDTSYVVTLFKEEQPFRWSRPQLVGKQHVLFGFNGSKDSVTVEMLAPRDEQLIETHYFEKSRDSLHYWYKPEVAADSLLFLRKAQGLRDTTQVRFKELYRDSLVVSLAGSAVLKGRDSLILKSSVPLISANADYIEVTTTDSLQIEAQISLDKKYNRAAIFFEKEEDARYKVKLFPGALTDFFDRKNDSLSFSASTKNASDYGSLSITVENVESYPVIIQLLDDKYKIAAERYMQNEEVIHFDELLPKKYYLRLIYDKNKNRRWDTGSYLRKQAPERVIYYPHLIDVRANWSLNEIFILKKQQ